MSKLRREELHDVLLGFADNVYYQKPVNTVMLYPCIVYKKTGMDSVYANNMVYQSDTSYQLTVIDRDPDSEIPEMVLNNLQMCSAGTTFVFDKLHHTILNLVN